MIIYTEPQQSEGWFAARRGVITGSRFKDCRDRLAGGEYSAVARLYAQDLARERNGGRAQAPYVNAAMRFGHQQEPIACDRYEVELGLWATTAGFICTDDRKFGVSVDRLINHDGILEVKTIVSSAQLFKVLVERDLSDYLDQVYGQIWILGRAWCDLLIWAPDLTPKPMTVIRIWRNDNAIEALESDLLTFDATVSEYEAILRRVMEGPATRDGNVQTKALAPRRTQSVAAPAPAALTRFEQVRARIQAANSAAACDLILDGASSLPADEYAELHALAKARFGAAV